MDVLWFRLPRRPADQVRHAESAAGAGGHNRRLAHDPLDDTGRLAAPSWGERGLGALFRLGDNRYGAAVLDHMDESGVTTVPCRDGPES